MLRTPDFRRYLKESSSQGEKDRIKDAYGCEIPMNFPYLGELPDDGMWTREGFFALDIRVDADSCKILAYWT